MCVPAYRRCGLGDACASCLRKREKVPRPAWQLAYPAPFGDVVTDDEAERDDDVIEIEQLVLAIHRKSSCSQLRSTTSVNQKVRLWLPLAWLWSWPP